MKQRNLMINSFKYLIIIFFITSSLYSQEINRSVIGSGAGSQENTEYILRGTVGQTQIGRIKNQNNNNKLGFWYTIKDIMDNIEMSSQITIPKVEAEIGEEVSIPIILVSSKNIQDKPRKWSAKIRFNATILYPLDEKLECGTDEICTLEINGENKDSIGILYELRFKSKLGSVESTDLEIIEFEWKDKNISSSTRNGFFQLKGVCTVDGEVRLIKRTVAAGITGVYPNPIKSNFNIQYQLREKGKSVFEIIDSKGKRLKIFDTEKSEAGSYIIETDIGTIPSGSYYLLLKTPNEVFTKRIMVGK